MSAVCAWGVEGHDPYYDPCESECVCSDDTCPDACDCIACHAVDLDDDEPPDDEEDW